MIERLSAQWRTIALVLLALLVGWFAWSVRSVLNPLILGYILAFVLHPMVLKLEARGWKRQRAVNFIFGAFAILIFAIGSMAFFQGRGLVRDFFSEEGLGPKLSTRIDEALLKYNDEIAWVIDHLPRDRSVEPGNAPAPAAQLRAEDLSRALREWWDEWLTEERAMQASQMGVSAARGAFGALQGFFGSVMEILGLLVLLPIYTWFLLFELERIHRFVARYLPNKDRERIVRIGTQIGEMLANFFRGRLLVCVGKGAFIALGLWIAGVDYALLLGFGTGFLSLIPFVGTGIGLIVGLFVGMFDHELLSALIRVGIVFAAAEAFENYVLLPRILGESLGLHPVVVIFALMAGAASLGMFGLLIALPLTASIVILSRELLLPVLAEMADKDRGGAGKGTTPTAR
jgi:predicted PurR-regulated permease PerM